MTASRVGREGFRGSPITDWCTSCNDFVVRHDSGRCVWCDSFKPKRRTSPERLQARRELDARIRGYRRREFSNGQVARLVGLSISGVRYRVAAMERDRRTA